MKKLALLIMLANVASVQGADITANPESILNDPRNTIRADDIPAGAEGYYYIPGSAAGADSLSAPYYGKTFKWGAGINLHMNRQCGELNPFKNIGAQLEANIQEKVEEFKAFIQMIPQMLASSAAEYALAKINPDLYQLTQLNIDEYFDLFQINIKTCEDVRNELMSNPDANPFDEFMQIAIGDEWKRSIGTGTFTNSRNMKKKIAENAAKNGIKLADGKAYGGQDQDPIDLIKSVAVAGINTIVGRNNVGEWNSDLPTKDAPIAKHFKNAKELVDFIEDIYGNQEISLAQDGTATAVTTKAGVGIGKRYSELRNKYKVALEKYADRKIDRKQFEKETNILIPPAEMDDIRQSPEYMRVTLIDDKAKQEAINTLSTKLELAQDALRAGTLAPEMRQSSLSEKAHKRYKELYYDIMDDIATLQNKRY